MRLGSECLTGRILPTMQNPMHHFVNLQAPLLTLLAYANMLAAAAAAARQQQCILHKECQLIPLRYTIQLVTDTQRQARHTVREMPSTAMKPLAKMYFIHCPGT